MDPDLQPSACLNVQKIVHKRKKAEEKCTVNLFTVRTNYDTTRYITSNFYLPGMISQTAMMANPLVDQFTKVKAAVEGRKNFKNHNQKFRSGTKVFLHHHHQRYQLFRVL